MASARTSWRRRQATAALELCRSDVRACPVWRASSAQVLGLLPPASHRSGVRRSFPILTSVSDDLSAREARASRLARGWERGRRREAGQLENTPPSASLGQWAPPATPRLRERYERLSPRKVRAEPERRPDHPHLNITATSQVARHEPREEN